MKLDDLFEDFSAMDLKRVEAALDRFVYQPEEKIKARDNVLDVYIPTSKSNHFVQRLDTRSEKANINLGQVFNLIKAAKTNPSFGFSDDLNRLSREQDPEETLVLKDPENLTIPVVVVPNPECSTSFPNNPVCKTASGSLEPKNRIIPKTIFRKGFDD